VRPRDVLRTLRLEDGRRLIDAAYPWQLEDILAVLEGERPYGYFTRSRGRSKTTDLSAVVLSFLLAADGRFRAYWLASDAAQAALAIDTITGFVQRTPALRDHVQVQARRVIVPESGAQLEILPADAAGAWGLTPHLVVADELANWGDTPSARRLWEAASSAVTKRDDAKLVVLTTPSSPDHWSFKVLEAARGSSLWRVSERIGPSPWMSEDRLAEQKARLPHSVYEQLFEGRWTQSEGSFLDPAVVDAAFLLEGPRSDRRLPSGRHIPGPFVGALDLGIVSDRTSIAIGHQDGERMILDRMQVWQGSRRAPVDFAEVESFIVGAHERFGFRLLLDPWQGLDLAQRLRGRGVPTDEYTFSSASKQKLAAALLSTINNGKLRLYEADGLRDELLALRLVQSTAGAWGFDHRRGGHDDRAVSLALMCVGLLERPVAPNYAAFMADPEASFFAGPPRPSVHSLDGPVPSLPVPSGGFNF
jgi:hypothetical protein